MPNLLDLTKSTTKRDKEIKKLKIEKRFVSLLLSFYDFLLPYYHIGYQTSAQF